MFVGLDMTNVHGFEKGYCWVWLRLRLVGVKVCVGLKRDCSSQADFRPHSKSGSFATLPLFENLKCGLVQVSDPHCIVYSHIIEHKHSCNGINGYW